MALIILYNWYLTNTKIGSFQKDFRLKKLHINNFTRMGLLDILSKPGVAVIEGTDKSCRQFCKLRKVL